MRQPWIVAHRGASAECPENTVAAFERAVADGCDAIELDVQLSRDGIPVVFHDWTLAKAGRRGRRVSQLDAAELERLDVGSWFARSFRGEGVPTLAGVLERLEREDAIEFLRLEGKLRVGVDLSLVGVGCLRT